MKSGLVAYYLHFKGLNPSRMVVAANEVESPAIIEVINCFLAVIAAMWVKVKLLSIETAKCKSTLNSVIGQWSYPHAYPTYTPGIIIHLLLFSNRFPAETLFEQQT